MPIIPHSRALAATLTRCPAGCPPLPFCSACRCCHSARPFSATHATNRPPSVSIVGATSNIGRPSAAAAAVSAALPHSICVKDNYSQHAQRVAGVGRSRYLQLLSSAVFVGPSETQADVSENARENARHRGGRIGPLRVRAAEPGVRVVLCHVVIPRRVLNSRQRPMRGKRGQTSHRDRPMRAREARERRHKTELQSEGR